MNSHEFKELIKIIIDNRGMILNNNRISKNTFRILNGIINGSVSNETVLSQEQKELIIQTFIKLKKSFNKNTPNFILENIECIKSAVSRNPNSVNYLDETTLDDTLKADIIQLVVQQDFILTKKSPSFLCNNFQIAKKSIALNINSADYIDWLKLEKTEINQLLNFLLNNNYILHSESHSYLKNNVSIVLASIKDNINNIVYASERMKEEPEIFKYLLLNGFEFSKGQIISQPLSIFTDPKILQTALNKIDIYTSNNQSYQKRLFELCNTLIHSRPKIKDFDEILRYYSELAWENERIENSEFYHNIFGKICAELRNGETFQIAIQNLAFFDYMQKILKDKYYDLTLAMQEFYTIYHSNASNKLEKLEPSKNTIARLSALYTSQCKDNFINESIEVSREYLYPYFNLNINNSYVYNQIVLSKQKELFIELYQKGDENISKFIQKIIDENRDVLDSELVKLLIDDFLIHNNKHIQYLLNKPNDYELYVRYKTAQKLIYRLNNGYIKYQDCEVISYHDIIIYDYQTKKYIYNGQQFQEKEYLAYEQRVKLCKRITKDIMLKVKGLEVPKELDQKLIDKLADELPFNDNYFIYNQDETLAIIFLIELLDSINCRDKNIDPQMLIKDETYQFIYNLLINKSLMWCFLTMDSAIRQDFETLKINPNHTIKIINNLPKLFKIATEFNFDLNKIKDLWFVYEISSVINESDLAILGKDIISKLYNNLDFTDGDNEYIIRMAKELICQMTARNNSTVPYVSGKYLNYRYSLYDSQDNSILIAGIDTDACFRIDGYDNDFLHYCALDKNGFVIKITDEFGNFIARASGFRHGNCVFINQLRTIYDQSGNEYTNHYNCETEDIVKTFKIACQDILKTSQNNLDESQSIDFVFVTKSYCLDNYPVNISEEVIDEIDWYPMDNESDDWTNFINNTKNLRSAAAHNDFTTDYGLYPVICMASIKDPETIEPEDLVLSDVPALYDRPRNKINISTGYNENIYNQINKIEAILCYINKTKYQTIAIPDDSLVATGDNWYVIYRNGKLIQSGLLAYDHRAKMELQATTEVIEQIYQNKVNGTTSLIEMLVKARLKKL